MKIKAQGRKKKINTKAYYWWMVEDKPKSRGRLSQLSKSNRKLRKDSEFIKMARKMEEASQETLGSNE